jgi:haloalkane dehalogenase
VRRHAGRLSLGVVSLPDLVDWCAANTAGLEIARYGPAGHHSPEDEPAAIAPAITGWVAKDELRSTV